MKLATNLSLLRCKKFASSKIFGSFQNNALCLSKSATSLFFDHIPVHNQRGLAARLYATNTKPLNDSAGKPVTELPAQVVRNRVKLWLTAARNGKDEFTRKNMDAQEFVPLSILATYPSCKGFTIDQLRTILKDSNQFEFTSDGTKIRLNLAYVEKKKCRKKHQRKAMFRTKQLQWNGFNLKIYLNIVSVDLFLFIKRRELSGNLHNGNLLEMKNGLD